MTATTESANIAQSCLSADALVLDRQSVPLRNFLIFLNRSGMLNKLLREWSLFELLKSEVESRGIKVSDDALQQAADAFRRSQGLCSAERTSAWLESQLLTMNDFESKLESALLREELCRHVTAEASELFRQCSGQWDLIQFQLIATKHEGLANELKTQLLEENADFSVLASEHSVHTSRKSGGRLKPLFRDALKQIVGAHAEMVNAGDLIGPVPTSQGWLLVQINEVLPGTFNESTEAAIRKDLFQQWLSARIRESKISYPLLDLLSCSNDS